MRKFLHFSLEEKYELSPITEYEFARLNAYSHTESEQIPDDYQGFLRHNNLHDVSDFDNLDGRFKDAWIVLVEGETLIDMEADYNNLAGYLEARERRRTRETNQERAVLVLKGLSTMWRIHQETISANIDAMFEPLTPAQQEEVRWREKDAAYARYKAKGEWPCWNCVKCKQERACCQRDWHHRGDCCTHCGNDEREKQDG